MAKDCYSGNSGSSNPFIVLNNTPTVLLQQVIGDLDISIDNVEEQIDIFRAKELSRATLVEANYRNYLEKLKNKNSPQE